VQVDSSNREFFRSVVNNAHVLAGVTTHAGLVSRRLCFREWSAVDAPLAISLWGDPRVTALIGGPFSAEQACLRLEREIAIQATAGIQYWPMFLTSTQAFVGCCGVRFYRPEDSILELGFHLLPAHWGQGLAFEAAGAVIDHAFRTLGAVGLFAGHHPNNIASERLLHRLGFRYTHREHYEPTGLMHRSYMLLASEFSQRMVVNVAPHR
jgi:RimJ/RimL family protein N-acetyltransferase